jgi:asparagine synthase (glutamine-hydrolysing)
MCGIAGTASLRRRTDLRILEAMGDALEHRGPDDAGVWESHDHTIGLAHRRLAIIDLTPQGHQPMSDVSGSLSITFNGEIYNYLDLHKELLQLGHRFRTASDTEVILEAYKEWGVACLSRFDGMFAFALYDASKRILFLARDPAGEKPLFYSHSDGAFLFASELKSLMKHPGVHRVIDIDSMNYYLAYGCVPGSRCILRGISKLLPGNALTYDVQQDCTRVWRYWELPPPSMERSAPSATELVTQLKALLLHSVRLRMIADVPVGVLLSGGIDSSIVAALSAEASSRPIKTFTLSIPGYKRFDETGYARLVATHLGSEHVEETLSPASVDLLPELARQFDEPLGDSSIVPTYLLSRSVRRHVKTVLSGDGGDELFGGYQHYNLLKWLSVFRAVVPSAIRSLLAGKGAQLLPIGARGRNHLIGLGRDSAWNVAHVNMYFDMAVRRRLLSAGIRSQLRNLHGPEEYKSGLCPPNGTVLQQATSTDFHLSMVDDYLVKVDRCSMLASLEVRAPFLDKETIAFAFSRLPDHLRAGPIQRKILLRKLAQRILPARMDLKRKQGLSIPIASWFRGEWLDYASSILSGVNPDWFDKNTVLEILKRHRMGMANSHRLFSLIMFELWRREYNITVPCP